MRLIAFLYKPDATSLELAQKWLSLTQQKFELYSVPQYSPEDVLKEGDYVITFGLIVEKLIEALPTKLSGRLHLPKIKDLAPIKKNQENREKVKVDLEALASLSLTPGPTKFQVVIEGRELTILQDNPATPAGSFLTEKELEVLHQIVHVLGVNEVKLIRGN